MVTNGEISKKPAPLQLFLGEYQPNLTKGGRIALPKKIRELMDGKYVILTRGFENCVFGYTKTDWKKESEKALVTPTSDKKSRMLKRYMFSGAFELEFGSQGRVVLPKTLLDYADLRRNTEVILIGAGDHFEIWNKTLWEKSFKNIEDTVINE